MSLEVILGAIAAIAAVAQLVLQAFQGRRKDNGSPDLEGPSRSGAEIVTPPGDNQSDPGDVAGAEKPERD